MQPIATIGKTYKTYPIHTITDRPGQHNPGLQTKNAERTNES